MTKVIKGLAGNVSGFHEEVKKLQRPYVKISESEYEKLKADSFDYYLTDDGQIVTFGNADGGYALMPLNPTAANEIRKANGIGPKYNQLEIIGVKWDDDGLSGLPDTVTIDGPDFIIDDNDELDEYISDALSDKFGYTHLGWSDHRFW